MHNKDVLNCIGSNIRAERTRVHLTQATFAEKIGISEKHLGKIERGEVNPKITTVISMMNILNIPFDAIYRI